MSARSQSLLFVSAIALSIGLKHVAQSQELPNHIDQPRVRQKSPVAVSATIVVIDGRNAMVTVSLELQSGWSIYSITQKPGGPIATKIELAESKQFEVVSGFHTSQKPQVQFYQRLWPDLPIETHTGTITWHARVLLAEPTDAEAVQIQGKIQVQAEHKNRAIVVQRDFTAKTK